MTCGVSVLHAAGLPGHPREVPRLSPHTEVGVVSLAVPDRLETVAQSCRIP